MRYLTLDGMLSGTGVRDSVEGGFVNLSDLPISEDLRNKISNWASSYQKEHFSSFKEQEVITALDDKGRELCEELRRELPDSKVEYYSAATLQRWIPPTSRS